MRLKKILAALLVSLTICTITVTIVMPPLTTEAHGHHGCRDERGLGSYYYHCGGYPAHFHPHGVCPYANSVITPDSSFSLWGIVSSGNNNNSSKSTGSQASTVQQNGNNTTDTSKQTVIISDTSYDNAAFNAAYYANRYEDLYETFGDDAESLYNYFITSGIYEGQQASEEFSILVYKENNQDLIDVFGDDLIKYYHHFIEYGVNEDRISK